MSEHNSIYDLNGVLVGRFKHGVAWSSQDEERLGEYDDDFVYDNDGSIIAKVNDGYVLNIIGEEIGNISSNNIIVNGAKTGSYIGYQSAGAASIALIFSKGATSGS